MYLKEIQTYGFKSFADKMNFELTRNINGIVGPNGSGKSNVVDAVRWVLGEQSNKQLRADNATSVIFSGSKSRKPLNSAMVNLIFDNTDRHLPIDFNEISIKRVLYRTGDMNSVFAEVLNLNRTNGTSWKYLGQVKTNTTPSFDGKRYYKYVKTENTNTFIYDVYEFNDTLYNTNVSWGTCQAETYQYVYKYKLVKEEKVTTISEPVTGTVCYKRGQSARRRGGDRRR